MLENTDYARNDKNRFNIIKFGICIIVNFITLGQHNIVKILSYVFQCVKDLKGKGLGSDMLNNCLIPYVKSASGTQLALVTNTEQNCKFYEKNGFDMFDKTVLDMKLVDNYCFIRNLQSKEC